MALGDHRKQTATACEVFLVLTHVFGEVLDTLTKKRYLEVSTASVTFVQLVVGGINFGICTHGNISFRPAPCQSALVREAGIKQILPEMQGISATNPSNSELQASIPLDLIGLSPDNH